MSEIRAFVAAALVAVPMLTLHAALSVPRGTAPVMSDTRPTTVNNCYWIYLNGIPYCVPY